MSFWIVWIIEAIFRSIVLWNKIRHQGLWLMGRKIYIKINTSGFSSVRIPDLIEKRIVKRYLHKSVRT
jgi:hypothetical protein